MPNLRQLVAHANLLDSMLHAKAKEAHEKEVEENAWFIESLEQATEHGSVLWPDVSDREPARDSLAQRDTPLLLAYRNDVPAAYRLFAMSADHEAGPEQYENVRWVSFQGLLKSKRQRDTHLS